MKREEIKNLVITSLDAESSAREIADTLDREGVTYDFSSGFTGKVIDKIFSASVTVNQEIEFVRSMNYAFKRIALTGIAAIILLMLSIFIMNGSFSLNSIFGLGNNYDETIVCMLTGK
jgi:hypothetical protein